MEQSRRKLSDLRAHISAKGGLKAELKRKAIVECIIQEMKLVPQFVNYKNDMEFLTLAVTLAGNCIKESDEVKLEELVMDVYRGLFQISEAELLAVSKNVTYLKNNGLVEKIPKWKIWGGRIIKLIARYFRETV